MSVLRQHKLGVVTVILAAIAALLILFAFDARAWQSSVRRDDIRFRALPDHVKLWKPATLLPFDPAGKVLGTADTMAFRRALQSFWYVHVGANPELRADLPTLRARAQQQLLTLTGKARTPGERSDAANLLGVLVITTPVPTENDEAIDLVLKNSIKYFQQAITLDPTNTDAKENLELVLRITKPGKGRLGRDAHAGFGFGKGHGTQIVGNGY
ncbi:MAG TPA: hypothetical protein VKR23_09380 [Gaiellaceae bacterium]|nr:hypothetical protein [Gaiellaceae bacterium]